MNDDELDGPPPLPPTPDQDEYSAHTPMEFTGETWDLILLILKNTLLTIITLGIYFPFAKNNIRHYFWSHVEFDGQPFEYTGTGMELFKGYIFAVLYFGIANIATLIAQKISPDIAFVVFGIYFLCTAVIIPFAMYGSHSYKMSRTRLRGISLRVSKAGRKEFMITFAKYLIITLLTLGLGSYWMQCALRRVRWKHTYYGNVPLCYDGEGFDVFVINLFNSIVGMLTLGIYLPWGIAKLTRYHANSMHLGPDNFDFKAGGFDILLLYLKNALILILTLGIGLPWIVILNMRFYVNHFVYTNKINYASVVQVEHDDDEDGFNDSMVDFLDMDFGF